MLSIVLEVIIQVPDDSGLTYEQVANEEADQLACILTDKKISANITPVSVYNHENDTELDLGN
jgi:hypothetical protein